MRKVTESNEMGDNNSNAKGVSPHLIKNTTPDCSNVECKALDNEMHSSSLLRRVARDLLWIFLVLNTCLHPVHSCVNCSMSGLICMIQMALAFAMIVLAFVANSRWGLYLGVLYLITPNLLVH